MLAITAVMFIPLKSPLLLGILTMGREFMLGLFHEFGHAWVSRDRFHKNKQTNKQTNKKTNNNNNKKTVPNSSIHDLPSSLLGACDCTHHTKLII